MNGDATSGVLGPLGAFLSSVTWAVGSTRYSQLSKDHSAFAVNFGRALVALPLFLAFALILSGGISDFTQLRLTHVAWLGLSIFASYGFGDALFYWSTRSLGVPGALAIASTYPLLTALAGIIFRGEHLTVSQAVGLFLTVFGVMVVILNAPRASPQVGKDPFSSRSVSQGVALAFATACFWTLNSISLSEAGKEVNVFVGNSIRMVFALTVCFVMSRIFARGQPILMPARVFRGSVGVFAFEAFGGSLFFFYGLAHSPLAIASTLSSLAPVLSVPIAVALGTEKFSVIRTLGICVVMVGLSLLVRALDFF